MESIKLYKLASPVRACTCYETEFARLPQSVAIRPGWEGQLCWPYSANPDIKGISFSDLPKDTNRSSEGGVGTIAPYKGIICGVIVDVKVNASPSKQGRRCP